MVILEGDCFDLIKDLEDNSVDLVITSPPYADIVNYGKEVSIKKPDDYVDWLLPLFKEIHRVLKPSGSFILNINDNCKNGLRNTFIYDLISRNNKETKLKLYDTYIWHKKNGIPNGSKKRFRNMTEYIFHFVKNQKELKFYMDRVLTEPADSSKDRYKYDNITNHGTLTDGKRIKDKKIKNMLGLVRPDNVFRFSTASGSRDNTIKHPAPFHKELPEYFINLLTDEGDVVLDVFSGIGTTGIPCKELNRQYVGFELNPKYVEFSRGRIEGNDTKKYKINQYDMEGNYIASFDGFTSAANSIGYSTPHNIMMCYRGFRNEAGGYKWRLEEV